MMNGIMNAVLAVLMVAATPTNPDQAPVPDAPCLTCPVTTAKDVVELSGTIRPLTASPGLPKAIQEAIDALQADAAALAATQADLAQAMAVYASAQARVLQGQQAASQAQQKLANDQAALAKAIADAFGQQPTPVPIPVPPEVAHPITILEIASTTCAPCNAMDPIIKELAAEGIPIRRIDADKDPAAAAKYKVEATPTFICLVDGEEVSRMAGRLQKGQIAGWYSSTVDWVAKKYPPK